MGSRRNATNSRWSPRREGGGARGVIASDGLRILVGRRPEGGNRGDVQKDSSTAPMADGEFSPAIHLEQGFRGISVLQDPAQGPRGFLVRLRTSGGPLPRNPRAARSRRVCFRRAQGVHLARGPRHAEGERGPPFGGDESGNGIPVRARSGRGRRGGAPSVRAAGAEGNLRLRGIGLPDALLPTDPRVGILRAGDEGHDRAGVAFTRPVRRQTPRAHGGGRRPRRLSSSCLRGPACTGAPRAPRGRPIVALSWTRPTGTGAT